MTPKIRTAVLISGRGSNMVALADAAQAPDFPADISLVISNRPDAQGIDKAKALGIKTKTIDHKAYASRKAFETVMHDALVDADIELICCAGFMRILSPWFIKQWPKRILNIHPSLLPKYKGLNTHARALAAGDKEHGCTMHYVSEELDAGEIIAQSKIDILKDDTPESLAARLIEKEHTLYVNSLKLVSASLT